jgi:hypothetical protein
VREYFYFDTNVYRDVVEENWYAEQALLRTNKKRFKLATTTILELLEALYTRPPNEFATSQSVLQFARDTAGHSILPVREEFLAHRLFHTSYKSEHLGRDQIRRWINVAIRYRSKTDLGTLVRVGPLQLMALDVAAIRKAENEFRGLHTQMITGYLREILKEAGVTALPPVGGPLTGDQAALTTVFFQSVQWKRHYVRMWAKMLGRPNLTPDELDELWPFMQPAGEFLSKVLLQSIRDRYNFERNSNDVTDEAHLSYLCDPSLTFVTQDKRLRSKLSTTSLARVISFEEFKKRIAM